MSGSTTSLPTYQGSINLYQGSENSDKLNEWQLHELEQIKKLLKQQTTNLTKKEERP